MKEAQLYNNYIDARMALASEEDKKVLQTRYVTVEEEEGIENLNCRSNVE